MNQTTKDFRKNIADKFIKVLTEKQLNWKKEWSSMGTPVNAVTGKPYKGLNRFWLSLEMLNVMEAGGKADPRWATFKQINDKGWKVKKGAKGHKVEYWQPYDFKEKKPLDWKEYRLRQREENVGIIAKYYVVFNGRDIEGIPELEQLRNTQVVSDELIQKISSGMGIEIQHDGNGSAYYRPSDDSIHLPKMEEFHSTYAYNATALHELSHATGAEHRLNRDIKNAFGSEKYAYEELVAEISSCFMSEHLEIEQSELHVQNHQAYVQSWIKHVTEQPDALIQAIRDAGSAANYLEYQAGILTKEEYENTVQQSFEESQNKVHQEEPQKKSYNIEMDLKRNGFKPTPTLISKIKELNRLTGKEHSIKDIRDSYQSKSLRENPEASKIESGIVKILRNQELKKVSVPQR